MKSMPQQSNGSISMIHVRGISFLLEMLPVL